MLQTRITPRRLAVMKTSFQVMALPAFSLGLAMALNPRGFWSLFGLDVGIDAVVAILYGCVLMGVGVTSLLAIRQPQAHASVFLFMGVYKGASFLALILHGLQAGTPMPLAGWVIGVAYLGMSVYCLLLYPWRSNA